MAWTVIDPAKHAAGKPVSGAGGWAEEILGNLEYLYGLLGTIGAGDIPNGSFEIDSDAGGIPDLWTRGLYPGGIGSRDTANAQHGAACIKLVHPGGPNNGGGFFESDYVTCSPTVLEIIGLLHWATAAGLHNKIQVKFYTAAKLTLSTTDLYDSTANPTTVTQLLLGFTPPATARFYKLILTGGMPDIDVIGTAYFDALTRHPMLTVAGLTNTAATLSTSATTWTNVGTITVTFPSSHNLPTMLSLLAAVNGEDTISTTTGIARLMIGAAYSNELTGFGTPKAHGSLHITAPNGSFETAHGSKLLTITVQLKSSHTDGAAHIAIAANNIQGSF